MGSAASAGGGPAPCRIRSTVLDGKPLDASDIENLDDARKEIKMLRGIAMNALTKPKTDIKRKLMNSFESWHN